MTRFDRRKTEGSTLPVELGKATEELWNLLDRQVQAVLEAAQTRAAELEREAESYATKSKQESEAKAQEILEGTFARASRVLDSIALIENALSGMLDALRAELASMAPPSLSKGAPESELSAGELAPAAEGPASANGPSAAPATGDPKPEETPDQVEQAKAGEVHRAPVKEQEPEEQELEQELEEQELEEQELEEQEPALAPTGTSSPPQEPQDEHSTSEASSDQESELPPELDAAAGSDPMLRAQASQIFRAGITAQVRRMVEEGKSRAEVERFLASIRGGHTFLGILDQFYPERSEDSDPVRRGFLRRRRRRDAQ